MKNRIQLTRSITLGRSSLSAWFYPRVLFLIPLAVVLVLFASRPAFGGCEDNCDLAKENTLFGSDLAVALAGIHNTGFGHQVLGSATDSTGSDNSAFGDSALQGNLSGNGNTACGAFALQYGSANFNTALGTRALLSNGGDYNTATSKSRSRK